MKTESARTAKAIRKELKKNFPDVKFKVRSSIYSGGNSVDIFWTDGPSERAVDKVVGKYQEGHDNNVEDLYEYDNRRSDIPQVTFVQCQRELSNQFIINSLKKYGLNIKAEEIDKTNHEIFDKYDVWTYRQLVWKLEK